MNLFKTTQTSHISWQHKQLAHLNNMANSYTGGFKFCYAVCQIYRSRHFKCMVPKMTTQSENEQI